jgi:DNA-binding transcriptional regulator YbjK
VMSLILKEELEKIEQWIEQVEKDGTAQTIIDRNKTSEISSVEFLVKENARYRQAGLQLARAAMYVIEHYDGLHRLSKAVSDWMLTIYNEGGRGEE